MERCSDSTIHVAAQGTTRRDAPQRARTGRAASSFMIRNTPNPNARDGAATDLVFRDSWHAASPRGTHRSAMPSSLARTLILLSAFALVQCDPPCNDAGSESACLGAPCAAPGDCENSCGTGIEFPGGMCTRSCGGPEDCPAGSTCIFAEDGLYCFVTCDSTEDCRPGYSCAQRVEAIFGPHPEFIYADVCAARPAHSSRSIAPRRRIVTRLCRTNASAHAAQ